MVTENRIRATKLSPVIHEIVRKNYPESDHWYFDCYSTPHLYELNNDFGNNNFVYGAMIDLSFRGKTIHNLDIRPYNGGIDSKEIFKKALSFTEQIARRFNLSTIIGKYDPTKSPKNSEDVWLWFNNGFRELTDKQRWFYEKVRKVNFYDTSYHDKNLDTLHFIKKL